MLKEGKLGSGWSIALLFASCLVSRGVGVDSVRDRLTVLWCKCRCQKKSERLRCHASLTGTKRGTQRTGQLGLRCSK